MAALRRAYRVRPLAAALLCLPGLLITSWYAWKAYGGFDRYRRIVDADVSLTVEEAQLQLHDVLRMDARRATMGSPPERSKLPHYRLEMSAENMAGLHWGAELDQQRPYVGAKLELDGQIYSVRVRLRGQQHWHLIGAQKSLKIKLPKGKLLDGHRVFNLLNDPTPMVVGEALILNEARKADVLTPRSEFARVSINGSDLGVYHYETQPDESLLRDHQRIPGSIYSGNLPGSAETKELWRDTKRWRKVAARNEEAQEQTEDLERLLHHISTATVRQFVDFARHEIDLEAMARFDALDVAFGSDQHDFRQNHKLYFDPYRGRWEPVAWNFRGFKHDPSFNLVDNPLLLRLKQVPEFVSLRNRVLYEMLEGRCSVAAVRRRGLKLLKGLAPELAADPHWHAYKLLPRVDAFHRRMVRPMNLERAALVFESELTTFSRRRAFLTRELEHNPLWLDLGEVQRIAPRTQEPSPASEAAASGSAESPRPGEATYRTKLQVIVDGRAGVDLQGLDVTWQPDCTQPRWRLLRGERDLTGAVEGSEVTLPRSWSIYPAVGSVAREDGNRKRGKVHSVMLPTTESLTLESSCRPRQARASGEHLATGSQVRSRPAPSAVLSRLPEQFLSVDEVPQFVPGEIGPHPGDLERPEPEVVTLGPGSVRIPRTQVFGAQQTVKIAAGTQLSMGEGASLIFLGPVHMEGTERAPILIEGSEKAPWGGIALQGPATVGSTLRHVVIRGGTAPRWRLIPYPGMLNLHDTKAISIRHCWLGDNHGAHDVVHAAYLRGLDMQDTVVERAADDAVDLEFVRGELVDLRVFGAGDDALDLMGSRLELRDSVLMGAGGNAISAGEETELSVRGTLVARSKVGVLAKNASAVALSGSLLHSNKTGLRVYQRTVRYAGASELLSDALFVVGSKRDLKIDDDSKDALQVRLLRGRLPRDGSLEHLRSDVLELDDWSGLDGWMASVTEGIGP